jgi:selenocysteine lyase/cysteine desulfurase
MFLKNNRRRRHFTAHSMHYLPDVSFDAHMQAWHDMCWKVDDVWEHVFSKIIPQAQMHIAKHLEIPYDTCKNSIVFAPNTHELVFRLLSSLLSDRERIRIVTTDSEFDSFHWQAVRLEELPQVEITRIQLKPFETFDKRCGEALKKIRPDFALISHVCFDSGFVVDPEYLVHCIDPAHTLFVLDGYHGFCAVPISLKELHSKMYYVAGGYKYAQSGPGVCFMIVPNADNCKVCPLDVGWFSQFENMGIRDTEQVHFPQGSMRFAGGTFDFTALYRFNAVMRVLDESSLSVERIHEYVCNLQNYFIRKLNVCKFTEFNEKTLEYNPWQSSEPSPRAHFLSFRSQSARNTVNELREQGVVVDARGDLVRIGFGLYHDVSDVNFLVAAIREMELEQ